MDSHGMSLLEDKERFSGETATAPQRVPTPIMTTVCDLLIIAASEMVAGLVLHVPVSHAFVVTAGVTGFYLVVPPHQSMPIGIDIMAKLLNGVQAVRKLALSVLVVAIVALILWPALSTSLMFALLFAIAIPCIAIVRGMHRFRGRSVAPRRSAIYGMGHDAVATASRFHDEGVAISGLLTEQTTFEDTPWPRLGSCNEAVDLYRRAAFDEIRFSVGRFSPAVAPLALRFAAEGIPFQFISGDGQEPKACSDFGPDVGIETPLGPIRERLNRVVDVVVSLAMLFVSAPLFAVLAVLIRASSPGPVIFRQKRVGKDGKEFVIYKFRTMRMHREPDNAWRKGAKDDRVTRIGHLLRKTSLDEIPQFINVLRGEMSVVGPRPEMAFVVSTYTPLERARLSVKPGITGVWQLSPYRHRPIQDHIYYDLFYIQRQSLALNFVIMGQTILFAYRGT